MAYAYVTNYGASTISQVILPSFTVNNTLAVGSEPNAIAIDPTGTYAYVTNYGSNSVSQITLSTFVVNNTLTVGSGPFGIAIDPTGTYAYVMNYGSNSVTKINLSTFATVGSALTVGTGPRGIAIAPAPPYFPTPRIYTQAVKRASTWFSRVPWHETVRGLVVPEKRLILSGA